MLQKLNERIQGVVAWLVVLLIAITFTMFGVDYYLQSHHTGNAKVTVNGQPLSDQTFENNYRRLRAQQEASGLTAQEEKNLQTQVLDGMITNEVSMQAAHKYGFEVSTDEANAAIVSIPQFQENGHFSAQKYQQALSSAMFTQDSFLKEVRQGMLLNQQRFAFIATAFALPNEIERYVRLYMQTRDYDYVLIPQAQFVKEVQVTEPAIEAYYKQHKKEFKSPEQISLDYIVLSMHEMKADAKVSDGEVKKYYQENTNNYLSPAQWQVAHILFSVPEGASAEDSALIEKKASNVYEQLSKNPKDFDKLVAENSDDKLSIPEKGVLPLITAGQKDYDVILAGLTKPGDISKPEKTKHGYEIFKLITYKPASTRPFSEVATQIKDQLQNEKAQTRYASALEQLSDLSYQTPDSLVPVSDALKVETKHTELFSHEGGTNALTQNKNVINAAFSHDVLELGNNSEPIQLDSDSVAVVRVAKHIPTKQQTLAEVQNAIKELLVKQGAQAKAKEAGDKILSAADDSKIKWKQVKAAARDADKENGTVNELAFGIAKAQGLQGVALPNGDYAVVRLVAINNGSLEALDKEQRDSLMQQIEASYGTMEYDLYVANLLAKADVVRGGKG